MCPQFGLTPGGRRGAASTSELFLPNLSPTIRSPCNFVSPVLSMWPRTRNTADYLNLPWPLDDGPEPPPTLSQFRHPPHDSHPPADKSSFYDYDPSRGLSPFSLIVAERVPRRRVFPSRGIIPRGANRACPRGNRRIGTLNFV